MTAMTAATPARPTRTPTVRTAALPPSRPGATYAPPPIAGEAPSVPDYTSSGQYANAPVEAPARAPAVHSGVPPRVATPAPVRAAAPAAAASGAWRIQLGAFGDRSRATALWSSLSGRLSGAQPIYTAAGSVTRLQAGPYASRAAAERACAAVRPQGCFAVPR